MPRKAVLEEPATINEVRLVGRLSAPPQERILPSGDEIVTFRLVVDRESTDPRRVDAIECVAWTAALRRRLRSSSPGTTWDVSGQLRRRFWRSPGGAASRVEVEVRSAVKVA